MIIVTPAVHFGHPLVAGILDSGEPNRAAAANRSRFSPPTVQS